MEKFRIKSTLVSSLFTKVRNLFISVKNSKEYLFVEKNIKELYFSLTYSILVIFLAFAVFYLFMVGSFMWDVENLITIAELGTIITATLTVLIFTYASVLENDERTTIKKIGEYFLKSTVNFIIGIIFLIGFGKTLLNTNNEFGVPDIIFNFSIYINIILYLIAYAILLASIIYFTIGITNLLKKLYE